MATNGTDTTTTTTPTDNAPAPSPGAREVFYKSDLPDLFRRSQRTIDRWYRSGRLPPPLNRSGPPIWGARGFLAWLNGAGAPRRRR